MTVLIAGCVADLAAKTRRGWAGASMPRVLVTYASRMGSTEEVAQAIGDRFSERGLEPVVLPVDGVGTLAGFDAVIIGSAVYLRRWLPEATRWLKANAPELAQRPIWLFQSGPCGSDSPHPGRVPRAIQRVAARIGTGPPVTFGGRLDHGHARSPLQRWVSTGPLAGDYRDWTAIRSWADAIVDHLARTPSPDAEIKEERS